MGILFGLTAALCWGTGDFLVTRLARRIGVALAMFYVQLVGLLATGGLLLAQPGAPAPSAGVWALTIGISVINMIGTLLLYRAFAIGTLALVAPITSGFAIVTALLALAAGERPAPLTLIGALLLIGGVIVISRAHPGEGGGTAEARGSRIEDRRIAILDPRASDHPSSFVKLALPAGVPEALGVVLCFGFYFWALDLVTPSLGILWPVLATRAIEVGGALLLLLGRGAAPALLPRAGWALVVSAALLDTLAFVAFNLGIGSTYTAIVTALKSEASAVTVLLAWVILRERLAAAQWAGVGVILMGVLLVSL